MKNPRMQHTWKLQLTFRTVYLPDACCISHFEAGYIPYPSVMTLQGLFSSISTAGRQGVSTLANRTKWVLKHHVVTVNTEVLWGSLGFWIKGIVRPWWAISDPWHSSWSGWLRKARVTDWPCHSLKHHLVEANKYWLSSAVILKEYFSHCLLLGDWERLNLWWHVETGDLSHCESLGVGQTFLSDWAHPPPRMLHLFPNMEHHLAVCVKSAVSGIRFETLRLKNDKSRE